MARIILILAMMWPAAAFAQPAGQAEMNQRLRDSRETQRFQSQSRENDALRTQRRIDNRMERLRTQQQIRRPTTSAPGSPRRY